MLDTDKKQFKIEWVIARSMNTTGEGRNQILDGELEKAFSLLKGYKLEDIIEAINYHTSTSTFPVKVADVTKYINQKYGLTDEQLKAKATEFFDKYLLEPSSFYVDLVIEDWRMAAAFKSAFTSFSRFARRNTSYNEFREDALRREFTQAALQFKVCDDPMSVPRVFEGFRNFDNKINVTFIGDYYKCKFFADQYYGPIIKEQQYIVQYPVDPALRIEQKKAEEPANEAYRENFGKWAEMFDKVLKGQMDIKDLPTE